MGTSKIIISILFACIGYVSSFGQCRSVDTLVSVYSNEIGIREATGHNDGARVELYLKSVGMQKGAAWCAAFVYWSHEQAGIDCPKSAWSPSQFTKKNTVYTRGVNEYSYRRGDVFGIYFAKYNRIAHVGFIDGVENSNFITVEGNTNEAGSREGDGVYRKRRPIRTIYKVARNDK